eukprot:CAMPEP_0115187558 /NCGR_PEP_ID=MMETSP0270-20121206/10555_1 /TAXON_ID=71861 /ORGANISM="Scrippsiella trochoidea, Strain CCMP3099" /LENGTH=156 /DNA_ID=CAMNT_0002600709 /DNA_START=46 /DNA_END=514 /DNA_ORIENTATION=-
MDRQAAHNLLQALPRMAMQGLHQKRDLYRRDCGNGARQDCLAATQHAAINLAAQTKITQAPGKVGREAKQSVQVGQQHDCKIRAGATRTQPPNPDPGLFWTCLYTNLADSTGTRATDALCQQHHASSSCVSSAYTKPHPWSFQPDVASHVQPSPKA